MFSKPLLTPPDGHPRLFLRPEHLPEIRQKTLHHELEVFWKRLFDFSRIDAQDVFAERAANDAWVIEAKALMYALYDDVSLGRQAKALLFRHITDHFNANYQDISREIGRLMLAGALVYDWCFDLLDDRERRFLIGHFKRLAALLECGYPPVREGAFTGHSNEWMVQRDMLAVGMAVYDEDPEMYDWAAGRFFDQMVPARNFVYASGWHHQGDAYGAVRLEAEMYPAWMYRRMEFGPVYDASQEQMGYRWIYARRPDGKQLRDGDTMPPRPGEAGNAQLRLLFLLLGHYYRDPYVVGAYMREETELADKDVLLAFLLAEPGLSAKSPADLPLTRYFGPPAGVMIARTGWNEEPDAPTVLAEMKIGIYQFNNHQHLDAGSFQLYYRGHLAIDSGTYKGTSGKYHSPHNKYYFKRTIAHNTMLVYDPDELQSSPYIRDGGLTWPNGNDGGQRWPNTGRPPLTMEELLSGDFKRGDVLAQTAGPDVREPDYSHLKGDLSLAYSDKVEQFIRSFVFINFKNAAHPAALIVFDRVVSANPSFRKSWLLHSIEEPEIEPGRTVISRTEDGYSGKLVHNILLPASDHMHIAKVGGPGREYMVFGTNYANDWPESKEQGAWRIEVSPRKPSKTDLFLNVLQVQDAGAGVPPLPTVLADSPEMAGAAIGDWVVWFAKSGSQLSGAIALPEPETFEVEGGDRPRRYLVTDLKAGRWAISGASGSTAYYDIDREGGVLDVTDVCGALLLQYAAEEA